MTNELQFGVLTRGFDQMSLSNQLNLKGHMVLDDIYTWPSDLVNLIERAKDTLIAFHTEQKRIDEEAIKDIAKRWNPDPNCYEDARASIIREIESMLPSIPATGFHGTRITQNEIEDITARGLQPLSSHQVRNRIEQRESNGDLSAATARKLLKENMTGDSNRKGRVCLVSCIESLKDEWGFDRLFRYWSGEAVYGMHEDNPIIAQELRSIGKPCIIIGSINAGQLGWSIDDAAGQCEAAFLHGRDLYPMEVGRDLFIKQTVPVLEIVKYADPRFEALTMESQWAKSMHP